MILLPFIGSVGFDLKGAYARFLLGHVGVAILHLKPRTSHKQTDTHLVCPDFQKPLFVGTWISDA